MIHPRFLRVLSWFQFYSAGPRDTRTIFYVHPGDQKHSCCSRKLGWGTGAAGVSGKLAHFPPAQESRRVCPLLVSCPWQGKAVSERPLEKKNVKILLLLLESRGARHWRSVLSGNSEGSTGFTPGALCPPRAEKRDRSWPRTRMDLRAAAGAPSPARDPGPTRALSLLVSSATWRPPS